MSKNPIEDLIPEEMVRRFAAGLLAGNLSPVLIVSDEYIADLVAGKPVLINAGTVTVLLLSEAAVNNAYGEAGQEPPTDGINPFQGRSPSTGSSADHDQPRRPSRKESWLRRKGLSRR